MSSKLTGIREHLLDQFNLELVLDEGHVQQLVGEGKGKPRRPWFNQHHREETCKSNESVLV